MTRRMLLLTMAVFAIGWGASTAIASHISDNIVEVLNGGTNYSRASGSDVDVLYTREDTVDNVNRAYAKSFSCTGCRTTAAAMQAVVITPRASTVVPTNIAVAINEECVSCSTFAAAYQYVVTSDQPVRFSDGASREIADIRHDVAVIVGRGQPFAMMQADLDDLYVRLQAVVDQELRNKGAAVVSRRSLMKVDTQGR
jgi:hypothetical protein